MSKLVYYKVHNDNLIHEAFDIIECSDYSSWKCLIVRDSKEMYKNFFVEEFTDKIDELADFLRFFCNKECTMMIKYESGSQCKHYYISTKNDLTKHLEHINKEKNEYSVVYMTKENPYLVMLCENPGIIQLFSRVSAFADVEKQLRVMATEVTFEEYELGETIDKT